MPMLALGLVGLLGAPAGFSQDAPGSRSVDFIRDIAPIFREHCLSCHGPQKQKGQLRLDSKASAFQGGTSGRIILPGKGPESRLVTILLERGEEDRMPQKAPALPPETIGLIRAWIDQGASWPDAASAGETVKPHWAYVKPARPPVPATGPLSEWTRNPVDGFIAATLLGHRLKPHPEAPRPLLLRRLYLDLIGLPPTPEEIAGFLSDSSPKAYEKVVDRLLGDPRYGERWGRHWMDVWRYSDWAGYQQEIRDSVRHIWRWRDWIVESVNADKPYDRMILEMLAGDEIAPEDPETLRATGFLARNWQKFSRDAWLQNVVEHTGKAFLATTLNCARCHSHFFDPISQTEYYQYRAFFEPYQVRTDSLPGQPSPEQDGLSRIYDGDPATTYFYVRGNEKNPDKSKALSPAVPRALAGSPLKIEPISLPRGAICPEKRPFVQRDLLAQAARDIEEARAKVEAAQQSIERLESALAKEGLSPEEALKAKAQHQGALEELPLALMSVPLLEAKRAALEATQKAQELEDAGDRATEVFKSQAEAALVAQRRLALLEAKRTQFLAQRAAAKAALEAKKPEALAAARKKLSEAEKGLSKAEADARLAPTADFARRKVTVYPAQSSGRRLALARWIADPENPLTARVAVNHLWMRHFGKPIVPTVFEFGKHGRPPSHPELLDWLATEFVRLGWSMKSLDRLLVTSSAYRMDSAPDPDSLAVDPENRWLWRMNPRRMESEVVRDSVLYVSGQLDLTRGGPEIPYAQGLSVARRSLYFQHAAEKQVEFLLLFDAANVTECYERTESVVPQQALAMANSTLVLDQSRRLARELSKEAGDLEAFLTQAFLRILSRPPTAEERAQCRAFLKSQAELLSDPSRLKACTGGGAPGLPPSGDSGLRAREDLVHVLFNHNDFVTIR